MSLLLLLSGDDVIAAGASARLVVGDRPAGAATPDFPAWADARPRSVYDVGDRIEILANFTDPELGDQLQPDSVTVDLLAPDGTLSSASMTLDSATGFYEAAFDLDQEGLWRYRVVGGNEAGERGLWVRDSAFD